MVKVKDLTKAKGRYTAIADEAARRYTESIPDIVCKEPAKAGQSLYEEKMRDPNVLARRLKKIDRVSDEEFKSALVTKGAPRIATGMRAGGDKWEKNFSPYKDALEGVTLPAKTADPIANIDSRLKPVVQALVNKKNEIG